MHLHEATIRTLESSDPVSALRALAGALADGAGLRLAVWVDAEGEVRGTWPEGAELSPALSRAAREAAAGEAPLCLDGAAAGMEGGEVMLVPLHGGGALALAGPAGTLRGDPAGCRRLGEALSRVAGRHAALRQTEEERDTLRQRAEESEALHVLGLAANRTLDPDEVLDLVARFTRTLLGAHYVTVSTSEEGRIRTVAAVGLRGGEPGADDPFAGRVAEARKPLVIRAEGERGVGEYPFHGAEGMQVGLGVPLSLFGETFGALVIGYRRPYPLAPRDTRLALTLAGHAAVAISNARLHRALADRSRELERAYEELRWTAEAKERFFASMSHELRTPLNSILGFQSLLLEGVVGAMPEGARSFLEKAYRATQNLLVLVNDVLDLSKIEAGKMELVVAPARLSEVLEEAVATVEPLAGRKGLRLEVSPEGGPACVATDADRVRQILINLLSNAVKFTDRGEVSVTVAALGDAAAEGGEGRGRWLEFRVRDTGPGIAPENHERIFHEFEQIAGATARGGTGLGLPISRKLARLLGGDLLVRSAPGLGSTFILRLPLRECPPEEEDAP